MLQCTKDSPKKHLWPVTFMKHSQLRRSSKPMKRTAMRGIRIDQADKYFSLFIRYRANWKCERCFKQYSPGDSGLHCSHFWGRARESTRFDPENASAHCHGCHSFFTANPELHREWKLKQIGQQGYDLLTIRAQTTHKKDRVLAAIVCKKLYEEEKSRFDKISIAI